MQDIWITDSQDEQSLEALFRDAEQIHIPIFQREYVWSEKELKHLCEDILLIQETLENSQFLGAVVAYERTRPSNITGRMKVLDIVDGQQRLLTLYIFVLAIAERLYYYDPEGAFEVVQEYLLLPQRRGLEINTRVVPSFDDRSQFRVLWDRINSSELMLEYLQSNPPRAPFASGKPTGKLVNQYERIISWLKKKAPREKENVIPYLRNVLEVITQKLTFVHLKLTDASVATKIFERLNFRGVKVDIGDLVRNEVFARVEQSASKDLDLYHNVWRPFEVKFDGREEGFYFPYCLIHNSNVKKSELFSELRIIWKGLGPVQIVKNMEPYQSVFNQIVTGCPIFNDKTLNNLIVNLYKLRAPSAMYPFLMQVLFHVENGKLDISGGCEILHYIESFIVRRSILGYEPTGLHAVFKGLWDDIANAPSVTNLKKQLARRHTVQVPTDKEIWDALNLRPVAKSKVCQYLLVQYDKHLPGDNPSDTPTIEHILPQSYDESGGWAKVFSRDDHKRYVNLLANVIPLSSPLNGSLQTSKYNIKRERYNAESMYVTPRLLANNYLEWTPASIDKRTVELYSWITSRWRE